MKKFSFFFVMFIIVIDALGGQMVTPSDTIHVIHYDIHLTNIAFDSEEITAHTTLTLTTLVDDLPSISLELLAFTVDSVALDGETVNNFTHQEGVLSIPLATPSVSGAEYLVTVWYHGTPFHEGWGGFHWYGTDYAFNLGVGFQSKPHNLGKSWFPCVDNFTDRALYDIRATVGEGLAAVSGGSLIGKQPQEDGEVIWHWQIQHPIPTYLMSIAVGPYILYADTVQGVERPIPVEIWTRPQDTAKVAASFVHLQDVMNLFEEQFGPYVWHKIGYSGTSIGAMEHAGNIAYPNFAINGTLNYESLWVHELSHMWFGDLATCHEAQEMWLNEGWAKYCENYYTEAIYDRETYLSQMNAMNANVLEKIHTYTGDGGYYALNEVPLDITYGMTSYDKGALIIHTLRGYMGDEAFFEAARHYLDVYHFDDASSEELRDAFAESSGIDLEGFFNSWVFQPGRAAFVLEKVENTEKGKVEVTIRQKRKGRTFFGNDNRFEIAFYDAQMNREVRLFSFDGEVATRTFEDIPLEPVMVVIDPDAKMMDAVTDKKQIFTEPGLASFSDEYLKVNVTAMEADSIMIWGTHYWVPPDTLNPAVPGLTFSDYHYWHVDGIFPEEVEGQLFFAYNKMGYLDNNLITNQEDSLVLLYRRDASHGWEAIDFTQVGSWRTGNLVTEEIRKGDYTLAIWDEAYVGIREASEERTPLQIHPNPSKDKFTFTLAGEERVVLKVFSLDGRCLFQSEPAAMPLVWNSGSVPAGTYTAKIEREGRVIASGTLIKK
ncbi:MAG: hypothetical protein CSA95_01720 [Bacteroidetes bacterium]|nr:MAG: hypothetical protein CSA95_01720 [Bacteroidota bacterium]